MNKNKLISFVLVLAMMLTLIMPAGAPVYAASDPVNFIFDISEGNVIIGTGTTVGTLKVTYGGLSVDDISTSQAITLIGTTTGNGVIVDGVEPIITLSGASIQLTTDNTCAFELRNSAKVTLDLKDGTINTLKSGLNKAGLQVPINNEITIQGAGRLNATGGGWGAGIGGNFGIKSGSINVDNGLIYATGGSGAAGIGGGVQAGGGNTNINGGTISAIGGDNGAGIGGGNGQGFTISGGSITITAGTVIANGGNLAAGIGGGISSVGGNVMISGGTITATGGNNGAGIGGGWQGANGGSVIISQGVVIANGGIYGAGIGGGSGDNSSTKGLGGTITISNGTVTATGGSEAAGIGGGVMGSGGTITISGGTVTAKAVYGAGIGGGSRSSGPGTSGGAITIDGGTVIASSYNGGAGIGGGNAGTGAKLTLKTPAIVKASSDYANNAIQTLSGSLEVSSTATMLIANYSLTKASNTNTEVFVKGEAVASKSFGPYCSYRSIAFTVTDSAIYQVKTANSFQQHSVGPSTDFTIPFGTGFVSFSSVEDDLDIAKVAADKAALIEASIKGTNADLANVIGTLTNPLPTAGSSGSSISWVSGTPGVISHNGQTIVRPAFGAGNEAVTLTATITKGIETTTKAFSLTVLAETVDPDIAKVASTKALVTGATYTMSQSGATNEAAVKTAIESKIATLALDGVAPVVTKVLYTPAVAGDAVTPAGINGTYTFTVGLSKGAVPDVTGTLTMNITATAYVAPSSGGSGSANNTTFLVNGLTIKTMENEQAILEIKTEAATYTLPAQQINIDAISEQLGTEVALKDIQIRIEIAKASEATALLVENAAKKGAFTIVAPPVEFNITCTYGGKTINVNKFKGYVERSVALPAGADMDKITTGVIIDPDGTLRHVPTKIIVVDGKYYAKINSLTNSVYSVIWNPVEFSDVESHWAKEAVNDMGSRMVIGGVGNGMFEPEREITRAEFAAIMVRSMGLKPGTGNNKFMDVMTADWYLPYVETAYEYGLLSGYNDQQFGPMDQITREQAMTMVARAMKITGLSVEFEANEAEKLLASFEDGQEASDWSKESMADCIKAGIVSGKSQSQLAPKDQITRAEVTVIVQRLLEKSGLI